ncbi:MAG: hypothetical protein M1830_008780 [Pleopsidium flavum]|nr:MAG: hypothetical protein M1830_008780 [Pleopsidium flavum]
MLLVHEYHKFATRRKPLRVTQRKGQQRSTYFLSLPLKYAVPLLVFWTAVHWFISETVYLTGIDIYNHYGVLDQERSFTGLNINGTGALVIYFAPTIIVLQLVLVLLGCRKLK